jgi:hypothetical protein
VPFSVESIVAGAFGGAVGSLITTVLSPPLRHLFWKREVKLNEQKAVIDEINCLLSHYLTGAISKLQGSAWQPSQNFSERLAAVERRLAVLFSEEAWKAYKKVEKEMSATGGLGRPGRPTMPEDFMDWWADLLRILYREIGLKV